MMRLTKATRYKVSFTFASPLGTLTRHEETIEVVATEVNRDLGDNIRQSLYRLAESGGYKQGIGDIKHEALPGYVYILEEQK